jgi:hypothetical protein
LRRVIYSEKYSSLPFSYCIKDESEGIPDDILRTKSLNWIYENEWRLILDVGDKPFEYDPRALKAIYFGCSMLDKECGKIAKILAKASTRIYKMQRSYKDYSIVPIPYSK